MGYPLNETILIEPQTPLKVFAWEIVRSITQTVNNNGSIERYTVEELLVTAPSEMKTKIMPGRRISVDNGGSWWIVDGNPDEARGGWNWNPGLVTFLAKKTDTQGG